MGWIVLMVFGLWIASLMMRVFTAPSAKRWPTLRRGLIGTSAVYIGILLMLVLLENNLLYHPWRYPERWAAPERTDIEDVWLSDAEGTRLHAWFHPVAEPRWYVLFCHGNGGDLSNRQWSCQRWQELGAAVLIFDYPGYGRSEGKPSEAGCQRAARAAYDWLIQDKHVPPDRLVLFGESLGCAMAVELATTRPCAALVLHSPFTSIPDMAQSMFPWLPARWLVRTRYDNLAKITAYEGPLFVSHGTADTLVPFAHGERVFAAAPSERKRFHPVPQRDHNDSLTSEVFAAIADFLRDPTVAPKAPVRQGGVRP